MSLNKRIARGRELEYRSTCDNGAAWVKGSNTGHVTEYFSVDYTKDPKLILELVLELLADRWELHQVFDNFFWQKDTGKLRQSLVIIKHKDFGIATAMAYCEEKGL